MNRVFTFDFRDIYRFEVTCRTLGEKTALKAAQKAAQKGSNIVGKEVRRSAPKGETGQLKKGFKKKKERSRFQGKFVYDYAMDPAKNDIFQKPIRHPGILGGKNKKAYYPSSIEYGFLARAPGAGYIYVPRNRLLQILTGRKIPTQKVPGTHFTKKAADRAEPSAVAEMKRVLNEELDKEWTK